MAVKIISPKAELAVLRGMVHKNKVISGTLLSQVDENYFHAPEAKEIFNSIKHYLSSKGETPSYRLLLEDPELSEPAREHFRDSVATIDTVEDAKKAARILNKYRQARGIHSIGVHISRLLQGSKLDSEITLDEISEAISQLRAKKTSSKVLTHIGKSKTATEAVKELLYNDSQDDIIPTGIKAYDQHSGGWTRGGLISLGASSGGFKSGMALQIAENQAKLGYKVGFVPLEMSRNETLGRLVANVSRKDNLRIIQHKLTKEERDYAFAKYRRWEKRVHAAGGCLTIYKPEEDVSIEDVFTALNSYEFDIVYVDYISLLKGADSDDSWQKLGAIARVAKINAESTNRVNVLLCQVNEDGKIRYSRAISEHSTSSWIWVTPKAEREKEVGRIRIEQPKARNSRSYPFEVGVEWAQMRVVEVEDSTTDVGAVSEPLPDHSDV